MGSWENHIWQMQNIRYPYKKTQFLISQSSSSAISLPFCTGMQPVFSKEWTQAFSVTIEHVDSVNNLLILYYTHNPQILFLFIPGVKIQDPYAGEVSCSISLPHYCSLLEKLSGPKSWPKQAALAHRCLDQERVSVPLRLPGVRSVGMIVQNYRILSLVGLYTDHQLGCRDKKEKQEGGHEKRGNAEPCE